jgi:lysophospholipase L1-like esterase
MRTRWIRRWLPLAAVAMGMAAPPASAAPGSPVTASVTLGDSFISGEAGRWQGNSNAQLGSRNGTDRAWVRTWYGGFYDADRIYVGGTDDNGCHRSDVAEVVSAAVGVQEEVNLSCSGASTANVFRAAAGGVPRNGEPPQADQLAVVARDRDVRVVVLSIGGNDVGFADIIAACATAWTTSPSTSPHLCRDSQQALVAQRLPRAMADVGRAVDEVRAVMAQAGYGSGQYRLVLQSYPSPVPRGAENRYPQSGTSRLTTGGCPFWDRDLDWARDTLVDQLADGLRTVAAAKGVTFLDLRDLLQGREACARTASLATSSAPPSETRSEWARFLTSGLVQGEVQESFHPNAYAQRALGRCLTLLAARAGDAACTVMPGQGASSAALGPLPSGGAPTATAARRHARADFRRLQRRARGVAPPPRLVAAAVSRPRRRQAAARRGLVARAGPAGHRPRAPLHASEVHGGSRRPQSVRSRATPSARSRPGSVRRARPPSRTRSPSAAMASAWRRPAGDSRPRSSPSAIRISSMIRSNRRVGASSSSRPASGERPAARRRA